MRNISNKIRFVAFVVVLLLGTISSWAEGIIFDGEVNSSIKFHRWNGVNPGSSIVEENPAIETFVSGGYYRASATVIGTGDVNRLYYADLTNFNGIRIKGTAGKRVRFVFNRKAENDFVEVISPINEHGVLELDFKDNEKLKNLTYYHLNAIKIPFDETGTVVLSEMKVFDRNYYFEGKEVQARQVYSMSYRVPINSQREFTFKQSRKWSDGAIRKYNWAMSVFDHVLEGGGCRELMYMDCSPTAYGRVNHNEQSISDHVDVTEIYKVGAVGSNGINVLNHLTEEMWNEFLEDMFNDADVSVKVANYDGVVRVYAVMKSTKNGQTRTYIYPYQYTKYEGAAQDVYVCLTEDHTNIWDLVAHPAVGLTQLDYSAPSYTGRNTANNPENCYATIYTEDGYALPRGTKTGLNDKVQYLAVPTWGWKFSKWSSGTTDNPHPITIGTSHITSGVCNPQPIFAVNTTTTQDLAANRIFHLDFENVTNEMLLSGDGAPINEPAKNEQGKFYNYGGKGRILKDDVFGNYYQNLADNPNEYTASKAENFLRYILTDEQQAEFGKINEAQGPKAATIGFWVNGKVAVDYELPLERGSMFCIFSNERFRKANDGQIEEGQEPRFMFDMSCNGWIYSYMPNSYYLTDDDGNYVLDGNDNKIKVDKVNQYFYGETANLVDNPKRSLFGVNNYAHTQDQRLHKFYDDKRWHYVTYVATEDLKKITMYLDGEKTGELDTRSLGNMQFFDEKGDYPGRARYLRNIVLGGFTPHGLFFEKQYYSDAALAYDDISIYSVALTQEQIKSIINAKGYSTTPKEWHFTDAIKAYAASDVKLDAKWVSQGNGVYKLNKKITRENLTSNNQTIFSTEGLTFTTNTGDIFIDLKKGRIGMARGAGVRVPNVKNTEHLYFVAKPEDDVTYPLDHYDIYPFDGALGDFYTRGVSLYGGNGREDCSVLEAYKHTNLDISGFSMYTHNNKDVNGNNHNVNTNNNIVWLSDIMISPYGLMYTYDKTHLFSTTDRVSVNYVDVKIGENNTIPSVTLPQLLITKNNSNAQNISDYAYNTNGNPYIRFSSSAPHVATVDQTGKVTLKGVAGYATIKAELVFDNLNDGCISTAYQIRVKKEPKTKRAAENTRYDIAERQTVKANDGTDAITMSLGGWAYTDNEYTATEGEDLSDDGKATDAWSKGQVFIDDNDQNPVDGFNTYSLGKQSSKSESYGNDDGRFDVTKSKRNVRPWTLPCRGSYLRFEAEKAGMLTVYVLQNGNLEKSNQNNDYSDEVHWRPVYITNERGVCVPSVQYSTNSKISENDNFFKEGRRRAQFIEEEEGTYNQRLKASLLAMRAENYNRFKLLLNHWENQGWKQKVIETGDGGYMIMSKGIVRYSFNVVPGQTYYVFSNDAKIGYAGYNFEEGKILFNDANWDYDVNPMYTAAVTTTPVVYKDELNYSPELPANINSMFSVPVVIERNFKANTWSSICLPFSINRKQLEENFGEGTSVVIMKKIHNSGELKGKMELVWHVNQDLIAGYPYFILPTKNVTEIKFNVPFRQDQERKLSKPYVAVSSNGKSFEHKVNYTYYNDYPYVFEGNFTDEELPAGSYVMSNNGVLTKLKNSVKAKPFRAYARLVGDAANAKPLSSMGFGDSESETTSIEELLQENGIILESSDVYGINGLKVRSNTHSLEGLSKGVYVVNGKKYVVK